MTLIVERVSDLDGYTVEWAEPENYYLSRRNVLFRSRDLMPPFEKLAVIDAPFWKRAASNSRLAQRLLRFMVTNIVPLENGNVFVTFDKSVGIIRNGEYKVLKGLVRPCRVLRSACAIDDHGDIYFGEYLANAERGEMHVYRYKESNGLLEIAFTFPPKSIRHIHGVYFDEYTRSLVCLTGDDENECRIIRTSDGFQTTEIIGQGDESWRAVSMLFDEDAMFYGMDAEYRSNHIYRLDRKTSQRKSLGEVNGTVFYSKQLGPELFFATTAENAPSQTENVAAIWHLSDSSNCEQIAKFEKDMWHPILFMFGTIHFPYANKLNDAIYFSLVGVSEDDRTYRIRLTA